MDLPYRFGANEDAMHLDKGFNMNSLMGGELGAAVGFCLCLSMLSNVLEGLAD